MTLLWPEEYDRKKSAIFMALSEAAGLTGRALRLAVRARGYPETAARVESALARAKRQPKGALPRAAKRALLAGQYNWARAYFAGQPQDIALAWNGLTGSRKAYLDGARDAGAAVLHAELAPFPGRITLDPAGVNAESSVPRDPAFFRGWAAGHDTSAWRAMGANLTARPSRRSDVGQEAGDLSGDFLFVPLQVPSDSQITLFSGWAGGLEGFVAALGRTAAALPEGWHLRLKEHPSARVSLAGPIAAAIAASDGRIVLDNGTDSFAQIAASRGVITVNSSMGLQSFFFDKPVIVTGQAFFAQPGLVSVADSETALAHALAAPQEYDADLRAGFISWLDQVYYPRYRDGQFDPAQIAAKLAQARAAATARD